MKIPTANVVIGFNKEVMERLFSAGATYQSLIQGLSVSGQDILLFNNVSNPNFISFDHSMNMGGTMTMKLQFIDPNMEFESRYISDNIVKNIAGFNYDDSKNTDKDSIHSKLNKKIKESQEAFGDQYTAEFLEEYNKEFNIKEGKEIYVAYGTGNNLDLWSGPHRTILSNMDISVKGARKITITLAPSPQDLNISNRRGAYNEVVNLNLAGLTMRTFGDSQPIKFAEEEEGYLPVYGAKYDPLTWVNTGASQAVATTKSGYNPDPLPGDMVTQLVDKKNKEIIEVLESLHLNFAASNIGNIDFHYIIVDAMRSYIQNATNNPNVIVLLPNINIICREWINESAKNARVSWPYSPDNPVGPGNMVTKDSIPSDLATAALENYFVEKFIESFCLEFHSLDPIEFPKTFTDAYSYSDIEQLKEQDAAATAKERYEKLLKKTYVARVQKASDKGIPDHMGTLQSVIDRILENSKEDYQIELGHFTETDTKILNLWTKGTGGAPTYRYPLFGGYNFFNENKEAIIYGDQALIQEYLYGRTPTEQKNLSASSLKVKATETMEEEEKLMDIGLGAVGPLGHQTLAQELPGGWGPTAKALVAAKIATQEAKLATIKEIPLHPLDQIILRASQYNKAIRALTYPSIKGVGAFGDISYLPDEFAYESVEFSDIEKKYITEEGIPVFRYNTQNPNILDMNFKFSRMYFGQLKMNFKKMVRRKASGVAEGVLAEGYGSWPIRTKGAAWAYLRQKNFCEGLGGPEKEALIADLATRISPELAAEVKGNNAQEAAEAIAAILLGMEKDNFGSIVEIEQGRPGNPQSVLTDFMEDVYRKSLNMTIKTLPTFHLAGMHVMSSPCIVFAQDAGIKQSNPPDRSLLNSFFSGIYKILGFKHTITTGACQSEFKLTKNKPKYKKKKEEDDG